MTGGDPIKKSDLLEEYYTNLHRAYQAMRRAFKLRAAQGLTQDSIARMLGVDKALISKRLNGSENLTLKTLSFMATAMKCRLSISYVPYEEVRRADSPTADAASSPNVIPLRRLAMGQGALSSYENSTATSPPSEAKMTIDAGASTPHLTSANVGLAEAA
jgi:hypothetical protein